MNRPRNGLLRAAIASAACLLAADAWAETANRIVAFVNDDIITTGEVTGEIERFIQEHGGSAPADQQAAIQQAILRRLVEERLILQEAKRAGVTVESSEVSARLDEMRSRFDSEEAFQIWLAESGLTEEQLKDEVREQLLAQRVVGQQVRSTVTVSPQEVAKVLGERPELAKAGDRVRISHVLIRVNEERGEAAARQIIDAILAQLSSGADFSVLARRHSEDPNAGEGGELTWMAQGELMPELDEVAFSLKPGEVSTPIRTRLGFHLIRLEERRASTSLSLMEANHAVYKQLYQQKFEQAFQRWMERLRSQAYIRVTAPS